MEPQIDDLVFGALEHDGYYYNGKISVGGAEIEFSIGTYQVQDVASRLDKARSIVHTFAATIDQAKSYAVDKLLRLKNDSWEEEDRRQIERQEFITRLTILSATLDHDGELVMYFDDGELFFGHDVLVTQMQNGQFDRAEIQG